MQNNNNLSNLSGVSLKELADKLYNQKAIMEDYFVPSKALAFTDNKITFGMNEFDEARRIYLPTESCHGDLANKLNIPKQFYDRLRKEHPDLVDYLVSILFERGKSNYLFRTFRHNGGGTARALLSDKYKMIDNLDVLTTALEAIKKSGKNVVVDSADLTDKRMYVRFIAPTVRQESPELLKKYRPSMDKGGDYGIMAGFILTNSETGHSSYTIAPRLVVSACSNGMIRYEEKVGQRHLGGKHEIRDDSIFSEETKESQMKTILLETKDCVINFLSDEYLGKQVDFILERGIKQLEYPIQAAQNTSTYLRLSKEKTDELVNTFIQYSDTTAFGLANAVTAFAQVQSPDNRYDLETASFDILENIKTLDSPIVTKMQVGLN